MKTKFFITCISVLVTGCFLSGCDDEIKRDAPEKYIYVNRSSLNMYAGTEIQLTASPAGENFIWSSEDEEIVSVNQTGLVKAVSEGVSSIVVTSASASRTKIEVKVSTFIPLTDISLSKTLVKLYPGDNVQIWASSVPENASEVTLSWRSENPDVATVDKNGIITAVSIGTASITVSSNSVERTVTVNVLELYKCDKTGWSIEVSDQHSEGGGKNKVIDGDYSNSGYWHTQYSPNVPLPHWAVIDMKEPVEAGRIVTLRRSNGDNKTLQYFVGDSPDANADTWVKVAEGAYASQTANHTLTLNVTEFVTGRYLKLVIPDSYRDPFSGICEIDVFGLKY